MAFRAIVAGLTAALLAAHGPAHAGDVAWTVRADRPGEQVGRLIGLFRGTRAADPAAALAAWTRANGGRSGLGKATDAALAALNPGMVRELQGLDGAEFLLAFDPETGRARWRAVVPRDDGRFGALAEALALTDGGFDDPLGGVAVLRLGRPGSPLAAAPKGRLALGSDRDGLRAALEAADHPADGPALRSGWTARLDPAGLKRSTALTARRVAAALDAAGCRGVVGWLGLEGETVAFETTTRFGAPAGGRAGVEPAWLDAVPASGVLVAVAVAVDPGAGAVDAAFGLIDRVERADGTRDGVAPLRTRLNLLAAAARVRPEVDLWPVLRGATVAALVDLEGRPDGVLMALHTTDPAAAARIAGEVLPRLASTYARSPAAAVVGPDGVRALGTVGGKGLAASARGASVLVGWGDRAAGAVREAGDGLAASAGAARWEGPAPQRFGLLWPGKLRAAGPPGSPLARALGPAPPVVWEGRNDGPTARDVARWAGARGVLKRWLDALPLDPPTDHPPTPGTP